jgi:hypothetical protein
MAKRLCTKKKLHSSNIGCKRNLGGYTGAKQLSSQAFAKISMRLVPNQEWEHITEFTKHFKSIWFSNRKVTSITEVRYDDSIGYKAANMAIRRLWVPAIPVRRKYSISFVWKELKAKQS